jgi:hypothetical protein
MGRTMGEMRSWYKILVKKSEETVPFGGIGIDGKVDLKEIDCEGVDWIELVEVGA